MERSRDKMLLPLTRAQLDFASVLVDANARGAKFLSSGDRLAIRQKKPWTQRPKRSRITCEI